MQGKSVSRRKFRSATVALVWALLFVVTTACALDEPRIAEAPVEIEVPPSDDVVRPDPGDDGGQDSEPEDPPTVVCADRCGSDGILPANHIGRAIKNAQIRISYVEFVRVGASPLRANINAVVSLLDFDREVSRLVSSFSFPRGSYMALNIGVSGAGLELSNPALWSPLENASRFFIPGSAGPQISILFERPVVMDGKHAVRVAFNSKCPFDATFDQNQKVRRIWYGPEIVAAVEVSVGTSVAYQQ